MSSTLTSVVTAPPALLLKLDETQVAMQVQALAVEVAIAGLIARTTLRMTFFNPHERDLEGELTFPLPEGAALSSYALDIGGELVEAALVEKEKARVVFEAEVRKNVDPGLIEKIAGNQFRTRIWPLPAGGTRTIQVSYVSSLSSSAEEAVYDLPLRFEPPKRDVSATQVSAFNAWGQLFEVGTSPLPAPEGAFSLRVEVARGCATPAFRDAEFLGFSETASGWSAELRDRNQAPARVRVAIPWSGEDVVAVEAQPEGEHHFRVDLRIGDETPPAPLEPGRVAIVWDASASRATIGKEREFALLRALLKRWGSCEVELIALRDTVQEAGSFSIVLGEADALLEAIAALPCDGGTRLEAMDLRGGDYDLCLLFSDGLSTLGDQLPPPAAASLYVVSSGGTVNAPLLRYLAESGGGAWVDLEALHADEAAARIGVEGLSLLGCDFDPTQVADLLPAGRRPVHEGTVGISGRLLAERAEVTLRFGRGSEETLRRQVVLTREGASETGLVGRLWAQAKVDLLSLQGERFASEILALGRRFHLVTPNTSLIVLETLEQHLEHSIAPASSRTKMRAAYDANLSAQAAEVAGQRAEKLEQVHVWWTSLVSWWEQEYDLTPPQPAASEGVADGFMMVGASADDLGDADPFAAPVMRPPSLSMPEPAAEACFSMAMDTDIDCRGEAPAPARARMRRSSSARDSDDEPDDKKKATDEGGGRAAGISVKGWDPDTPYLAAMKEAGAEAYSVYLGLRSEHGRSPSFYLDCASYFFAEGERELALRVLSNVAELELENPQLLRIVGYKLETEGELEAAAELFERVRAFRAEEPQSFRDLALVRDQQGRYRDAVELLWHVVTKEWDGRFPEIETIALMELNRVLARAERAGQKGIAAEVGVEARFLKLLDLDLRIALAWDADLTDVDLWVFEPYGEKCDYSNNRTRIGGRMSCDFTQGYGPEVYTLRRGAPGAYKIEANYYGSGQQTLTGPATLMATVFTNFGRADEERQTLTLRVTEVKDVTEIGEVALG